MISTKERKFYSDKLVTCIWGDAFDFTKLIENTKISNFEDEISLIEEITTQIQDILYSMRVQCEELHREHLQQEKRFDQLASFESKLVEKKTPVSKTDNFAQIYAE